MSAYTFKVFGHRGSYACKCNAHCYEGKTHILEVWADGVDLEAASSNALEKAKKDTRFNPKENIYIVGYKGPQPLCSAFCRCTSTRSC